MKTAHTKGPWRVGNSCAAIVTDHPIEGDIAGSDNVEYYGGYLIAESVAKCNAPLLAAAPDLLEALQAVLPFASQWVNEVHPSMKQARAAIAKATEIPTVARPTAALEKPMLRDWTSADTDDTQDLMDRDMGDS